VVILDALRRLDVEHFLVHVAGSNLAKTHFAHHVRLQRLHVLVQHGQGNNANGNRGRRNDHSEKREHSNFSMLFVFFDVFIANLHKF